MMFCNPGIENCLNCSYPKCVYECCDQPAFYADEQVCIADFRKQRKLSQAAFAKVVGISARTLYDWERGYKKANWEKLCSVVPEISSLRPDENGGVRT